MHNEALLLAAFTSHTACFELLIERGADIRYSEVLFFRNGHLETRRSPSSWTVAPMHGQSRPLRLATDNHDEAVIAPLLVR